MKRRLALFAGVVAVSSCGGDGSCTFRMIHQPKFEVYERHVDGPPPGTVPRERKLVSAAYVSGSTDGGYLTAVPVPVTRALLERGRRQFDIHCATCHGLVGDGESLVARNFSMRPPPSLHARPELPPGQIYDVATRGFGVMPSYAAALNTDDRWAVAAYVGALRRSQRGTLDDVPPDQRQKLQEATP